jgi:hypothetical protein
MVKVTTKSKSSSSSAVRQMRGPGMNKGLKKPRHGQFTASEPTKASQRADRAGPEGSSRNDYSKGSSSYLSSTLWK